MINIGKVIVEFLDIDARISFISYFNSFPYYRRWIMGGVSVDRVILLVLIFKATCQDDGNIINHLGNAAIYSLL